MKIVLSLLLAVFVQDDAYRAGKAQIEAKQYDAAEASFRQILESDPSRGNEGLALVYIGRKDYNKALEHARKAVESNGESADAHYSLGLAYAYRKDFKGAAPSLTKALELNPNNAYAHYQLGVVQYQLKRYDQTIIHFEKFLEMMPDAPEAPQVKSILKTVRG